VVDRPILRSRLSTVPWPALPDARGALLLALLHQLRDSQHLAPEVLRRLQFLQLGELLRHAFETTRFYAVRLAAAGYRPGTAVDEALLARLPVLSRHEVQQAGAALHAQRLPAGHGAAQSVESAGSTGTPVRILATPLTQLFWEAFTLREHEWQGRDLGGRLAVIRFAPELPPQGRTEPNWGPPASWLYRTGPCARLNITTPVDAQARWLLNERPDYLLTHPTNAMALAQWFIEKGERLPSLKQVRTISEALPSGLHEACAQAWDAPVADVYSTRESGYLALQCPTSGLYHVQAEGAIVEVLREDGAPCAPGEIGRVVVTVLHNFACPLLRYDTGDLAKAGPPCGCGRTLPTLEQIAGRVRNMLVLPAGQRLWPSIAGRELARAAPVRQFQVIQESLEAVRVLLVVARPLELSEEERVADIVRRALGHPFRVAVEYRDEIARSASGKYEEFRCEVT
jgi:phenylacetate-CoA ligase